MDRETAIKVYKGFIEPYFLIVPQYGTGSVQKLQNRAARVTTQSTYDISSRDHGHADMETADMENADMENADMENADMENADMENMDMENADMENADMENADMENADMENADMENADMENADMENTDMENADMENADMENADKHVKISYMVDGLPCNRFCLDGGWNFSYFEGILNPESYLNTVDSSGFT